MNNLLKTKEEIKKKFSVLPKKIQAALYSPEMISLLEEIGKKHNLHIDKVEYLMLAVEDVMVGAVRADQFIDHVAKELELPQEEAEKIAQEVDQQIFENIRDAIKSLSHKKEAVTAPKKTELPVVATTHEISKPEDVGGTAPTTTIPVENETKRTIADIKTKMATSNPVVESNYDIDPYHEPIE